MGKAGHLDAEVEIKAARQLVGQCLVLYEAVVARRTDGLFVEPHGFHLPSIDSSHLGSHHQVLVQEGRGTAFRPLDKRVEVRRQCRAHARLPFLRALWDNLGESERMVEAVIGPLDVAAD